jgi:hypothetical protein
VGTLGCASASRCATQSFGGDLVTFNPQTGSQVTHNVPGNVLGATITCPSESLCVTSGYIREDGDVVNNEIIAFEAGSGKVLTHTPISLDFTREEAERKLTAALKECEKIENRTKRKNCRKKAVERFG